MSGIPPRYPYIPAGRDLGYDYDWQPEPEDDIDQVDQAFELGRYDEPDPRISSASFQHRDGDDTAISGYRR